MKETHIATLQGPRSSWYFGCDVHGEERRERLTTFSGCDIVIASDSVAMIGSPRGVGLATMWLERRKLISLPVSRDWAANDRGLHPATGYRDPAAAEQGTPSACAIRDRALVPTASGTIVECTRLIVQQRATDQRPFWRGHAKLAGRRGARGG